MGHIDINRVSYTLPDGRPLLDEVSFRVGDGAVVALVGPNGTGKTTLLRIISGDLCGYDGAVTRSGGLGVMRQFIGSIRDETTIRDLLISVAPDRIATAARAVDLAELRIMEVDDVKAQMSYAQAMADWGDYGGYEYETIWDSITTAALGMGFERCQYRRAGTLSGGEQKRLVLEALLQGPDEVLLLDEPDNYLDVPGKLWLSQKLKETDQTVLLVSHDRELLAESATRIVTLEPGAAGASAWTHPDSFQTWHEARQKRNTDLAEQLRRWQEEQAKLRKLMLMYQQKAAYNDGMASRYQAAKTRLAKFEQAGPPEKVAQEQNVRMRLTGGRTAKRAVICERLHLLAPDPSSGADSLMDAFDLEIWYGERVGVLGANGSGKSHFLRLLAGGGSDPELGNRPVGDVTPPVVQHSGIARLGSRVTPGWFAQTHEHHTYAGRTLLEILHRGDHHRRGRPHDEAARVLDRYELARAAEQTFDSLSGGQQARFQILMLELSGATLLLLDEPTDNLDLHSAEALEEGLSAFDGTVLTVTHDRWFARSFDRFLIFGADGELYESDEPVWDEARVNRRRGSTRRSHRRR
ncbi:putative ABC transporter ATP-binding protein YbiT [Austwickia sp. TVS 96-490-7B]|uniref:ABC-F family ATP-binding cassette domain-containing protein n=1 Tax=Austwickia sp. TVS 96-490-7B TaxID=2830843 RepID=UPI001C575E19|nr:ATP-binding cassette domain-containing protein [Austwickia sp. TVS 96-490-7B]MBW3086066.1 putative ABC transporter ATP-binding protein YbiT [Austwickia sp. TVS 96-490-7B]